MARCGGDAVLVTAVAARRRAGFTAQALVGGALAALWALGAGTPKSMAQPTWPTATPALSPCIVEANKVAAPQVLLLGETTTITLTMSGLCAGRRIPDHVVLVLDASAAAAGEPHEQIVAATIELIGKLDLTRYPDNRVGVVQFDSRAKRLCGLTDDAERAIRCVRRLGSSGGAAVDAGIAEALKVLRNGRRCRCSATPADIYEALVVFAAAPQAAGCAPVLRAANKAKIQGVRIVTVCSGPACGSSCLRQAATSARYFFEIEDASRLFAVFERIHGGAYIRIRIEALTITDRLPGNMRYVAGSAVPAPNEISPAGDVLTWRTDVLPQEGITITFTIQPLQPGHWPMTLGAGGRYADNDGGARSFAFPQMPHVTVLRPMSLVTPIDPPPTSTFTPPPQPPRPTPVGGPRRLWLPRLDRP